MYTTDDFYRFRKDKKIQRAIVDLYNNYCMDLSAHMKAIKISEPEIELQPGSLQQILDDFLKRSECLGKNLGYVFIDKTSNWNDWNSVDEGLLKYLKSCENGYFRNHNSYMNLLLGRFRNDQVDIDISLIVSVDVIHEDDNFCTNLSLFLDRFDCDKITVQLQRANMLLPVMAYFFNRDFSDLLEKKEELSLQLIASEKMTVMNESVLRVYIQGLCKKNSLQYEITKDNRGQVVKLRLPKRLMLRFRIKPENFAEQKEEIEDLLKQALDFVNRQTLSASIQYYGSLELWREE